MLLRHLLAVAVFAMPGSLAGQHPDFSGTWTIDATKSSASGQMAVPSSGMATITQKSDTITVDSRSSSEAGELVLKKYYVVDGKSYKNAMTYAGTDMALSSTLSWNGAALKIHTVTDYNGTPVEQDEVWSLSADGKSMTQTTTTSVQGAEWAVLTLVYVKK